ncbi:MAG: FAD-dependent oxidoreductase, partial [Planctomycetota bacterium]
RWLASKGSLEDLYQRESESTADRLREMGFSYAMVDEFFRPFLGGVYLDETLATSSRMLEFVFRMFAAGDIAVPADGMAAIPRQLADGLPRGTLQFRSSITALEPDGDRTRLRFADGSETVAQTVVLATESNAAARLLQQPELETGWNETTNLYFTANRSPNTERLLMLRGDEQDGPIQTAVVLSDVAPEYANDDKALISVSVSQAVCDDEIEDLSKAVIGQAEEWFGSDATRWKFLRAFRVPYGLPTIPMETVLQPIRPTIIGGRIYRCGDYLESPSIQGAMNSGMRVAEHLLTQSRI